MKVRIIINEAAGNSHGRTKSIQQFFEKRSIPHTIQHTSSEGDAKKYAQNALPGEIVVAAGGDGTVNDVINGVMQNGNIMGILPIGTANVVAIELGIPIILEHALEVLLLNRVRSIDVGIANGRYFGFCCGIGLDAKVVQKVGSTPPKQLKKAYFAANAVLQSFDAAPQLSTTVRGKTIRGCMMVASNMSRYAGDMILAPDTKVDDGKLTLSVFEEVGPIRVLTNFFTGVISGAFCTPDIQESVSQIRISSDTPALVHADAEIIGTTPVDISIAPRGLKILH